jgi:hypothetical protein
VTESALGLDIVGGGAPFNAELKALFHRLDNQLGIILAHAELLDAKAVDDVTRARAEQVVATALDAMATVREIHLRTETAGT